MFWGYSVPTNCIFLFAAIKLGIPSSLLKSCTIFIFGYNYLLTPFPQRTRQFCWQVGAKEARDNWCNLVCFLTLLYHSRIATVKWTKIFKETKWCNVCSQNAGRCELPLYHFMLYGIGETCQIDKMGKRAEVKWAQMRQGISYLLVSALIFNYSRLAYRQELVFWRWPFKFSHFFTVAHKSGKSHTDYH